MMTQSMTLDPALRRAQLCFVGGRCHTSGMDNYPEVEEVGPWEGRDFLCLPFPLEPITISLARFELAHRISKLPFSPYEEVTRSVWVAFAGDWGVWVRERIPVDDRLDMDDPANLTAKCDAVAGLLVDPDCYDIAIATVVLHRPGPPKPTPADRKMLRLITKAAAARDTVPWSFFIVGSEGYAPVRRPAVGQRQAG